MIAVIIISNLPFFNRKNEHFHQKFHCMVSECHLMCHHNNFRGGNMSENGTCGKYIGLHAHPDHIPLIIKPIRMALRNIFP